MKSKKRLSPKVLVLIAVIGLIIFPLATGMEDGNQSSEHNETGNNTGEGGHGADLVPLFLSIGLALVVAKILSEVFERIKQPAVIGEMLAGIILGPQLLNMLFGIDLPALGVDLLSENFAAFADIGVMMLLFLSGLEVEFDRLKKTGKLSGAAAIAGVILPFAGGYLLGMYFFGDTQYAFEISMLLGALLTATSVGVTARILIDFKALNTRAGTSVLGAAVIDDVLGIIILVVISGIAKTGGVSFTSIGMLFLMILFFFFVTFVLGMRFIHPIAEMKNKMVSTNAFIALAVAMALLFGAFAESIRIASIIGAFIAGLILGETPYRRKLTEEAKVLGYGFFIPLFFVYIGAGVDLNAFFGEGIIIMLIALVVAIIGKLVGCGGIAKLLGASNTESMVIGVGMIPRMEIGLVVASVGIGLGMAGPPAGELAREIFSLAVFVSIMTGVIPMFFLKPLLKKYKEEEEEKMLAEAGRESQEETQEEAEETGEGEEES